MQFLKGLLAATILLSPAMAASSQDNNDNDMPSVNEVINDATQPQSESRVQLLPRKRTDEGSPLRFHAQLQTRFDFDWKRFDGATEGQTGFRGNYLTLVMHGQIIPGLTYSWRQHLNRFADLGNDVFSATDWIHLDYQFARNWQVSAGKQIVAIGGYEYDANPINEYFVSLFWRNIRCFQFGVSGSWISNDRNHTVLAQITNSPCKNPWSSCYAYNLMWKGNMGIYSTLWSVNLIEYERGKYGNYIALGNKLDFGRVYIEADLMNRYMGCGNFLFGDFSVIGKFNVAICPQVSAMVKGGYEKFRPVPEVEATVDKPFVGVAFEVRPIRSYPQLRIHAAWDLNHDVDGSQYNQVIAGVTWMLDLISVR